MTWTDFEINGSSGEVLAASRLDAGEGAPVAVLCHGINSVGLNGTNTVIGPLLHDRGITVITFDLTGHGRSSGSFGTVSVVDAARDITDVVRFAQSSADRVGLLGNSFSGCGSILAAPSLDLACVGLKAPLLDWEAALTAQVGPDAMREWEAVTWAAGIDGQQMNFSSVTAARTVDAFASFAAITAPVRVWQGSADETLPAKDWRCLRELCDGEKKVFVEYERADHRLSGEHFGPFIADAVEFIAGHLLYRLKPSSP